MTQLSDLKQSISEMSDEELLTYTRELRKQRRTPKVTTREKRTTAGKASTSSLNRTIDNMSQENLASLIAILEGVIE